MAYVAKDDIIVYLESELNFVQGISQSYEIDLYKDFIGQSLNMSQPTSFHVAIYDNQNKLLQYSNPMASGVSDILNTVSNPSKLNFTITQQQSNGLPVGALYAEITIIYENYYPQPKTYIFPKIKIGESISNGQGGGNTGGGTGGGTGENGGGTISISTLSNYTIESVSGTNPTLPGRVSLDSNNPAEVTSIIFRNLDGNGIRLASLENFLIKRISNEGINGTISIIDQAATNMYAIYKILDWSRIDITPGNNDTDDSDGILINVSLETKSSGPGVTKTLWEVGQTITYDLDAYGITSSSVGQEGLLTYVDKNINPTPSTGDNSQTGITLTYSPYYDSYVMVEVNGISVEVGNGTKNAPAFFSGNSGLSAVSIDSLRAGDELIWNGLIAGFELESGDEINLIYEASASDVV
jgi:hypothetical protein